jgi:phospholipid/cholesterol/gamma-HCH transport system permease protein
VAESGGASSPRARLGKKIWFVNTASVNDERFGLEVSKPREDTLGLTLTGAWSMRHPLPSPAPVTERLRAEPAIQRLIFDAEHLDRWDSSLLTFLVGLSRSCAQHDVVMDMSGLPTGMRRLLELATAVPEKAGARRAEQTQTVLARLGKRAIALNRAVQETLGFIGEASISFVRMMTARARFQSRDLWVLIQECGVQALPIVSLISVLVGLILAFVGAVQLQQFGAQIFVADLVAIGMTREMGAMMAAIIMAGRTGAAFAAQLGTMQVNEEIDALKTLGISPIEFLVLPRMTALILMLPLLTIYADVLGIIGGAIVGILMLDLSPILYWNQTVQAVTLNDVLLGVGKSAVFGVLIALSGCLRGIQSGRSASAVGAAATSAVVTAIVLIVVFDGIFAVIANVLGI